MLQFQQVSLYSGLNRLLYYFYFALESKFMLILGINDTHDASACIIKDGKLLMALAEERLQRIKNMSNFPHHAIKNLFNELPYEYKDIDHVAVATKKIVHTNLWNLVVDFKINDYLKLYKKYIYPMIYEDKQPVLKEIFSDHKPSGDIAYPLDQIPLISGKEVMDEDIVKLVNLRRSYISKFIGINEDKIGFYDHHRCHALYGYYTNPRKHERVAIVTSDGGGDRTYNTVSVMENGVHKEVSRARNSLIGKIYSSVTLILGMNPHRHPYKVMGLAPYATEYHKKGPREVFLDALTVDGLEFKRNQDMKDFFFYFKDKLETFRFDGIAGGLQDFVEIRLTEWFENISKAINTNNFVFSGGVANNVKANKVITERDFVDDFYIPPGPSDESLSIGAGYSAIYDILGSNEAEKIIESSTNAYWGNNVCVKDHEKFKESEFIRTNYNLVLDDDFKKTAKALSEGEVVAFCVGNMEFGSRALGHRSLLADPSNMIAMRNLNDMIKKRDFWMPFTPSILDECYEDYVVNPKNIQSNYMTICFNSTDLAKSHLRAATHPYDYTVRPQRVTKNTCPKYHGLISEFYKLSGIGALLNTSLNVHEKPIVQNPTEILGEILTGANIPLNYIYIQKTLYKRIVV